jgi:hypothetical protein
MRLLDEIMRKNNQAIWEPFFFNLQILASFTFFFFFFFLKDLKKKKKKKFK